MDQFPGNSNNEKKEPAPKAESKKVERVVSGDVRRGKQPMSKRLKAHFLPQTEEPLTEHIFFNVLLPSATAAASEMFHQAVDIILPTQSRRGVSRRGHTSYSRISEGRREVPWARGEDPRDAVVSRRARSTHAFDQVIIDDRFEAQGVLDELYNCLAQYDQVTVGDFYDAVGEDKEFTDENYGWRSLTGTRIIRRHGGWIIDLPPTEILKRR